MAMDLWGVGGMRPWWSTPEPSSKKGEKEEGVDCPGGRGKGQQEMGSCMDGGNSEIPGLGGERGGRG